MTGHHQETPLTGTSLLRVKKTLPCHKALAESPPLSQLPFPHPQDGIITESTPRMSQCQGQCYEKCQVPGRCGRLFLRLGCCHGDGCSCLSVKYPQPTGAAGPVSASISKTGADGVRPSGPRPQVLGPGPLLLFPSFQCLGSGYCFTSVWNLPPAPEPILFPQHSLNSDAAHPTPTVSP